MEKDTSGTLTKETIDFVMWFKSLNIEKRDFVSALLIANANDKDLLRIQTLTESCGDIIDSLKI